MSKPVSINQYHLGMGVSGVFLLLLGSGEEWVGLWGGMVWEFITWEKA